MAALKGRLFRSATVFSSGFDGHRASVLACRRMPRPRAILFDLDDTLIHAHARPKAAWLAVTRAFADGLAPLTPEEATDAIAAFARTFWDDADRHRRFRQTIGLARRQIVLGALDALAASGRRVPSPAVARKLADRFTAYRIEQMRLCDGAHETLDALRARGVWLALITNGDGPGQRAKIERFSLAQRFDHIQIEGEQGFGKPDPRAYRHALASLETEPKDAWMIGDNLEWEVSAPQALGLYAVWCDHGGGGLPRGATVAPDRIITTVPEVLALFMAGDPEA